MHYYKESAHKTAVVYVSTFGLDRGSLGRYFDANLGDSPAAAAAAAAATATAAIGRSDGGCGNACERCLGLRNLKDRLPQLLEGWSGKTASREHRLLLLLLLLLLDCLS